MKLSLKWLQEYFEDELDVEAFENVTTLTTLVGSKIDGVYA